MARSIALMAELDFGLVATARAASAEDDPGFGHADGHDPLIGGHGQRQHLRVGQADILGGADQDPAGQKFDILAAMQGAGQIEDRGVRIAAAHGFDEGADVVVMAFAVWSKAMLRFCMQSSRTAWSIDDLAVRTGRGRDRSQLQCVQGDPGVAVGEVADHVPCACAIESDRIVAQSALPVSQRHLEDPPDIALRSAAAAGKTVDREISALLTSKKGFSVVAPIRISVPSST